MTQLQGVKVNSSFCWSHTGDGVFLLGEGLSALFAGGRRERRAAIPIKSIRKLQSGRRRSVGCSPPGRSARITQDIQQKLCFEVPKRPKRAVCLDTKATALREKEHAAFAAEQAESKSNIDALARAIPAIEKGMV